MPQNDSVASLKGDPNARKTEAQELLVVVRDALLDVLQPIRLGERSVKQGMALMIRLPVCMATRAGYMVRTMPPEACRGPAAAIDTAVRRALAALMHIDLDTDVPGLNISTL